MKIRYLLIGLVIMFLGNIFSINLCAEEGGLPIEISERKAADADLQSQIDALLERVLILEGQVNGCIPTGEDIPCDGIDQDCDGSDNTSVSPSTLTFVPDSPFIVNFCDYATIEIQSVTVNLNGCINDVSPGNIIIHYTTTGFTTTVNSIANLWQYWMYMDMDVDIEDGQEPVVYRVVALYHFDISSGEVYVDVTVQDYPWNLERTWINPDIGCVWFEGGQLLDNYVEMTFSLVE
jgi:hypothetical protein